MYFSCLLYHIISIQVFVVRLVNARQLIDPRRLLDRRFESASRENNSFKVFLYIKKKKRYIKTESRHVKIWYMLKYLVDTCSGLL